MTSLPSHLPDEILAKLEGDAVEEAVLRRQGMQRERRMEELQELVDAQGVRGTEGRKCPDRGAA